jgi:hypothetical protein
VRQVKTLSDFPVGQSVGGQLDDLQLLRGELIDRAGCAAAAAFARGSQFTARALAPGSGAEGVEGIPGRPQRCAGIGDPPLAAQPLSECQQQPCAHERPSGQVSIQRVPVAGLRVLVGGEHHTGVAHGKEVARYGGGSG